MPSLRIHDLPPLEGAYGHDLAPNGRGPGLPCRFSAMGAYRPLIEARRAGFDGVRVSLCEGAEGLRLEEGEVVGVHDRLLESVTVLEEAAALHGLYLAWTVLDGRGVQWAEDEVTAAILRSLETAKRFAAAALQPLLAHLDPERCASVTLIRDPLAAGVDAASAGRCAEALAGAVPEPLTCPITVSAPLASAAELLAAAPSLRALELLVIADSPVPTPAEVRAALPSFEPDAPLLGELADPSDTRRAAAAGYFAVTEA